MALSALKIFGSILKGSCSMRFPLFNGQGKAAVRAVESAPMSLQMSGTWGCLALAKASGATGICENTQYHTGCLCAVSQSFHKNTLIYYKYIVLVDRSQATILAAPEWSEGRPSHTRSYDQSSASMHLHDLAAVVSKQVYWIINIQVLQVYHVGVIHRGSWPYY